MRITPAHVLMPILCLGVGVALLYVGLYRAWGLVWAVAGGFSITVGLGPSGPSGRYGTIWAPLEERRER
jgi:hypothetical protein